MVVIVVRYITSVVDDDDDVERQTVFFSKKSILYAAAAESHVDCGVYVKIERVTERKDEKEGERLKAQQQTSHHCGFWLTMYICVRVDLLQGPVDVVFYLIRSIYMSGIQPTQPSIQAVELYTVHRA